MGFQWLDIYIAYMCTAWLFKELDLAPRLESVCEGCFKFDLAIMQRFRLVVHDIQHRVDDVCNKSSRMRCIQLVLTVHSTRGDACLTHLSFYLDRLHGVA